MESVLKYPHLFQPIVLGGTVFRNRVFSSPQGYYDVGPECYPNAACAAFFARKAEGGVASVCIGDAMVDSEIALANGNKYIFLLMVNLILIIAGCFIDANSAMYIFIPIMMPVAQALGYNMVAFGIVATVNLAIGQVTPPVGVNLFVALGLRIKDKQKSLAQKAESYYKVTLPMISHAVLPMIFACLVVLILITYLPQISLLLVR